MLNRVNRRSRCGAFYPRHRGWLLPPSGNVWSPGSRRSWTAFQQRSERWPQDEWPNWGNFRCIASSLMQLTLCWAVESWPRRTPVSMGDCRIETGCVKMPASRKGIGPEGQRVAVPAWRNTARTNWARSPERWKSVEISATERCASECLIVPNHQAREPKP